MALPLLAPRDLDAPLAWQHGRPISAATFLADAAALAARLPGDGEMLNLCLDRYAFAVGLAAALQRGQLCLLPPNALADTLLRLDVGGRRRYALADGPVDAPPGMPVVQALEGTGAAVSAPRDAAELPGAAGPRPAGAAASPPSAAAPGVPAIRADHRAACLLTSGSTGTPQPHEKTWGQLHANLGAAARRLAEALGRPDLAGLNLVTTVPAQHSYGFESSVMLALLGGAAFDAGRPFYPADIAAALAALPRPRALVTTPFHLKTLLLAGVELPPVDLILSATAPLSPQLAQQAERASGGVLVEIYGCTEAGQVATRRTVETDTWSCFDAVEIQADGERYLASGGHVGAPTELADVLELADARRFRLLGRANDLIRVAGKRSSLAHLNWHLNSIAGVQDGAFWLPDEVADGVVRPLAFVVAPGLPAADIVAALRLRVEPAFLPRRVIHVDALPREATGKLTVAALRRFALQSVGDAR